jgi:DNA polymerase I-like protein with 3'-5' exonuclease and polymerase domains
MIYYVTRQLAAFNTDTISVMSSLDQAVEYCKNKAVIGIDYETTGLSFIKDKPVLLAIGDERNQFVINLFEFSIEPLREILESREVLKIAHNVKFEYLFTKQHYHFDLENVFDTMLASQVINCGNKEFSNSLQNLLSYYLGITVSKQQQKSFVGKVADSFSEAQVIYAAKDIAYLPLLYSKLVEVVSEAGLSAVVSLENEAVLAFGDIEFNGMLLDQNEWLKLALEAEQNKRDAEKELGNMLESHECFARIRGRGLQLDLFDPSPTKHYLNWDSPPQAVNVFQCLHPSITDVEERTLSNVLLHSSIMDEAVAFSKMSANDVRKFITTYRNFKEHSKAAGAYGKDFLKHVDPDGRVRTEFKQILATGRVSSSNPNLQQIPSDNRYRNCFKAPPGWKYVSSDFSSQELAIIAHGSRDPVFLSALENKRDLHSVAAEVIYGSQWKEAALEDCLYYAVENEVQVYGKCDCPKHKKMRTAVKTINFGLAYGMTASKLADTLGSTIKEASSLIAVYFQNFPKIEGFLERLAEFARKTGTCYTYPPYKRRRIEPLFERAKYDEGLMGAWERRGKNTPIQGTAADMTKEVLIRCRRVIKKHRLPVKLVCQVHDQVDTLATEGFAEKWADILDQLMCISAKTIIPSGLLKAETTITDVWTK